MHSIVSQGKVDAVLASKPEDRRALVEEAAGLGKFKQRKHRAELKLARVATQVERARDVEDEVRKRLRPLALQATAAERAEKLAVEIAGLRVRVAQLDLDGDRRAPRRRRRAPSGRGARAGARRRTSSPSLLAERERAEEELSDAAGRRETALGALYRLQGASERLTIRGESADGVAGAVWRRSWPTREQAVAARTDDAVIALEAAAAEAAAAARDAAQASGQAAERARVAHARVAAAEAAVAPRRRRGSRPCAASATRSRRRSRAPAAGRTTRSGGALALGAVRERLGSRRESARALLAALAARARGGQARWPQRGGPTPAELEQAANEAAAAARAAATERDDLAERARATRERLAALERSIAEREGLAPAARALAERGERLALSELEAEPGTERAVAAALGHRASALLAGDAARGMLRLVERARRRRARQPRRPRRARPAALVAELPVVPLDELLDSTAGLGHRRGLRLRSRAWRAVVRGRDGRGGAARDGGAPPHARRRGRRARRARQGSGRDAAEAAAAAAAAEEAYAAVAHLRERIVDPAAIARARPAVERLERMLSRAAERRGADRGARSRARRRGCRAVGRARERASAALGSRGGGAARRPPTRPPERRRPRCWSRGSAARSTRSRWTAPTPCELARARRPACWPRPRAAARAAREATDRARLAEAALVARAPRRTGADPDLLGRLGASRRAARDLARSGVHARPRASRRPFGRAPTPGRRAPASSAPSCGASVRPRSSCAGRRTRQPSA